MFLLMLNSNERNGGKRSVLDLTSCDLAAFAAAVHAAIRRIGHAETERFGARKVFISVVASACGYSPAAWFGRRLVEANRAGLLSLARADLVAAMPAHMVAASEIDSLGSRFHFVVDQGARDAWELAS